MENRRDGSAFGSTGYLSGLTFFQGARHTLMTRCASLLETRSTILHHQVFGLDRNRFIVAEGRTDPFPSARPVTATGLLRVPALPVALTLGRTQRQGTVERRSRSEGLQILKKGLLVRFAQCRTPLVTASAVSRIVIAAIGQGTGVRSRLKISQTNLIGVVVQSNIEA